MTVISGGTYVELVRLDLPAYESVELHPLVPGPNS